MKRQTGVTLGGMMFFVLLLIFVAYSAARVMPGYMDYWLVGRALDHLVEQPDLQTSSEESIREQFAKQLRFNDVDAVNRSDLLIERVPGGVKLSVTFSVKRHYLGAVSLCMDFQAQANSGNPAGN